jgi:hypothetical protein
MTETVGFNGPKLTLEVLLGPNMTRLGWDKTQDRAWLSTPISKLRAVSEALHKYSSLSVAMAVWPLVVQADIELLKKITFSVKQL